ncbi:MAG: hypothetical protein ACHQ50_12630 [Fimbriimonadales bacterium]
MASKDGSGTSWVRATALAQQMRGKTKEARTALQQARMLIETQTTRMERSEFRRLGAFEWQDWLRCRILYREGEKSIESQKPGPKK